MGYCFNTPGVLMQAEVLKKIEGDEDIAEEFQDGNKADRGAESL